MQKNKYSTDTTITYAKYLEAILLSQHNELSSKMVIGNMRTLSERNIEHNQDVYVRFINYKKAFNRGGLDETDGNCERSGYRLEGDETD